ncbi:hypothetical protein RFI_25671 [Reticulomyxa filosa]|uniref:Uncharacterized protein n=1 Tax=Reticulomyxa filosa TaxID=46433 RepID=X6ME48_RETFI|nr:hypothetical protein RFI_25671 [Reticulomyxa filosa]|eukprot:ETO11707.1 hypothetical protein RFI_25671 [Reticulomyxa filosa]
MKEVTIESFAHSISESINKQKIVLFGNNLIKKQEQINNKRSANLFEFIIMYQSISYFYCNYPLRTFLESNVVCKSHLFNINNKTNTSVLCNVYLNSLSYNSTKRLKISYFQYMKNLHKTNFIFKNYKISRYFFLKKLGLNLYFSWRKSILFNEKAKKKNFSPGSAKNKIFLFGFLFVCQNFSNKKFGLRFTLLLIHFLQCDNYFKNDSVNCFEYIMNNNCDTNFFKIIT